MRRALAGLGLHTNSHAAARPGNDICRRAGLAQVRTVIYSRQTPQNRFTGKGRLSQISRPLRTPGERVASPGAGTPDLIPPRCVRPSRPPSASSAGPGARAQPQDGRQPENVEIRQRRRLLLPEVRQPLQGHLLRPGRIPGVAGRKRPGPGPGRNSRRVEGVEKFPQARRVELFAAFLDGLGHRRADAAALVAEQGEQAHRRAAQVLGGVLEGGQVDRGEDQAQAAGQHHPRADHLPGADLEVHVRHPVVADRQDNQTRRDQPAGVDTSTQQEADDHQHADRGDAAGRQHQPRRQGVVAKQGLEQGRHRNAARRTARERRRR